MWRCRCCVRGGGWGCLFAEVVKEVHPAWYHVRETQVQVETKERAAGWSKNWWTTISAPPVSVVVLAPLLLFLPQRPRKGLVELRSRRGVHDCSGFVSEAGACFSWLPRCSPGPLCGLLGAGQSPVWACSWGPLLRPCLLHKTEAAGVRCRRAENHGLALSQSFPSTLATLSALYHSWTALMFF